MIRGPLGIGKSTVAERLAVELGATCISIDRILDEHSLWEAGRLPEFLRANDFAAEQAESSIAKGRPVIFDGNFYWKTQIADLVGRLNYMHYIFTLQAPLSVCIRRDSRRASPHGPEGATEVYRKATKFEYGIEVDATRSVQVVIHQIMHHPVGGRVQKDR